MQNHKASTSFCKFMKPGYRRMDDRTVDKQMGIVNPVCHPSTFLKIVFVCLYITSSHHHHCVNLSEDIELIKCLSDIFCRVCKIRHILSVILYTIRWAVCFQFTHFLVMIEIMYILCLIIIIKSEVWTITHCLGLGHKTMVCAVCLFVFFRLSGNIIENLIHGFPMIFLNFFN